VTQEDKKVIERGEWVRLSDGRIRQFKEYINDTDVELTKSYNTEKIEDIVNHSKDIKDLIEIGDYINGCKVVEFFRDNLTGMIVIKTANQRKYYNSKIINSIVTKEQFRNAEYRI